MHLIPKQFIANYGTTNNMKIPVAVDYLCPFCNRSISFTSFRWSTVTANTLATGYCRCPACADVATFIFIEVPSKRKRKNHELYIYPAPKRKIPLEGAEESENLSSVLLREYLSAINVYNTNEWNATAVICRRLLEGITNTLLPKELHVKSLFQKLKLLPKHQNLGEPIIKLSDAIRLGGNKGAHFDPNQEPNEKTASLMLELSEYLLEYLFIIPQKVEHFHDTITKE